MRIAALLAGMLLAGGVQAQPASPADVDEVLQKIGVGHGTLPHGDSAAIALPALLPTFDALDADQRECAVSQLSSLLEQRVRANIIDQLGNDGSAYLAQWTAFLATAAGQEMARRLQALQSGIESAPQPGMDAPGLHAEVAAFMQTPAYMALLQAPRAGGLLTDAFVRQLADQVQRDCPARTSIEKIS